MDEDELLSQDGINPARLLRIRIEARKKKAKTYCAYAILAYSHLFALAFWGSLVAGFYFYGFSGEGDWTCYALNDEQLVPWDASMGDRSDDYHNVNANFGVICIWGFIDYLCVYLIFLYLASAKEPNEVVTLPIVVTALSHFVHFITMMILRWRHAGKVCSGDYLDTPNRYSLFDAQEPYLHNAGSFIYYAILSQFLMMVVGITGAIMLVGIVEHH